MIIKLHVHAGSVGVGAVLWQEDEEETSCFLSFSSRKLNKHQLSYSVVRKKALLLVWALQHFDVSVGSVISLFSLIMICF